MNNQAMNLTYWLLDRQLEAGKGSKPAVIDDHRRWSYSQLYTLVESMAGSIKRLPTNPGDPVAIISYDHGWSAAAFLAVIRTGRIACLINPGLESAVIHERLAHLQATAVILENSHTLEAGLKVPYAELKDLMQNSSSDCHQGSSRRLAFCLFTSGTTGHAQAVPHRHIDPIIMSENYGRQVINVTERDVIYSPSKLYFAYGLNSLLFALYYGATVRLTSLSKSADAIWQLLHEDQVSICFGVPRFYRNLLDNPSSCGHLPRLFVSAGERLPGPILQAWMERFQLPIIDGIGTTEILSTFISNRPQAWDYDCTGTLVPGFQARVVDQRGQPAAQGEVGSLWLYGDTYYPGYWNDSSLTAERFDKGWFNTRDLFHQDPQGRFYYHGRLSDMVAADGALISPYAAEDALLQLNDVMDCALVGANSVEGDLTPQLFIVLYHNADPMRVKREAVQRVNRYIPLTGDDIHFISEIPSTPAGKKQRYLLRAALMDNAGDM